ncbi:uncharacterized protein [Choristoneura fumiferana]|uniref:uncharacterized protein n=1 Tax=Choristoneura fumiferana TaxID=7141 RepID=UPI003D159C0C
MALDKQKILSDLGNVVNQLQSADCGCMGKLFSNPGQAQGMGASGGCRCQHSCCQNQGYGHHYSGASYPTHQQSMPCTPCMGINCNPPKLYSETYSYLNQNLMQPVIREVYDDLKSISPENTIMNNPMGNQLGLAQGTPKTPVVRGNMGEIVGQTPIGDVMGGQNPMQSMGGIPPQNTMKPMAIGGQQQQNSMGGMGDEILKMMMSSNKSQPMNMTGQSGQQSNQNGVTNAQMGANQSQYGSNMGGMVPVTSQYNSNYTNMGANQGKFNTGNMQPNQAQYNTNNMGMARSQNNSYPQMQNPTAQYNNMTQPNMHAGGTSQVNAMPVMANNANPNAQVGNMNANSGMQQMPAPQRGNYGQHSQGMAKFNEMFPGVTQGMGGNLDFDPMSIAIQMNPANQKQATMNAIEKIMSSNSATNKPLNRNAVEMQPVMNGINAVNTNFTPTPSTPNNQMQLLPPNQAVNQQFVSSPATATSQMNQMQPQVVYTAGTDELANQEGLRQQKPVGIGEISQGGYPNQLPARQEFIKDPVYPVDTTKFPSTMHGRKYEYNTLGQPVEPLPQRSYRRTEPSLPQTLSPQPVPSKLRYPVQPKYVVKNTVSKTSLFGNNPVGKTPSRRQLQHVYNTYKGSVSSTKQNVRSPHQLSASDGRLRTNQHLSPVRQVPVERVGGDTIANNQLVNDQVTPKGEHFIDEVLDAAANQPYGDGRPEKPVAPSKISKCRNGLQDLVFTSYPQSSAWSFHGHNHRQPF